MRSRFKYTINQRGKYLPAGRSLLSFSGASYFKLGLCFLIFLGIESCEKDPTLSPLNPIEKEGWEMTFHDEFESGIFDSTKWRPDYRYGRYHGTTEGHCASPDNIAFQNGHVSLLLKKQNGVCSLWGASGQEFYPTGYTAGLLCSSETFEQSFGFFEIRCKIPSGQGITSAFWLVSNLSWPPEIDIFESQGKEPGKIYVSHSKSESEDGERRHFFFSDLSENFHTYAAEWTPEKITYYLDNRKLFSTRKNIPVKPMHIIASLGVGGGIDGCGFPDCPDETTSFPAELTIDHIRVYRKTRE